MSALWLLAGFVIGYRLGRARNWISNVITIPNLRDGELKIVVHGKVKVANNSSSRAVKRVEDCDDCQD